MIMNLPPVRLAGKIAVIFCIFLAATGASFGGPSASLMLQISGTGTVSPLTNGQALMIGQTYSISAKAKSSFTFAGWSGSATSSNSKLSFVMADGFALTATFIDKQKPTLTIQALANSSALTNPVVFVTGTAKDNDAVANVFYNFDGQGWLPAATGNNWNNWWVNVTNLANTNVLQAYAIDRHGNCSKTNRLKMTYSAAPTELNGMTITVADPDSAYYASFGSNTFSEATDAGSYTYKKTGPVTGKLSFKYNAPPSAVGNDAATLTFTDVGSGTFTADGTNGSFTLATATNLALAAVTGAGISFADGADSSQTRLLSFLTPPNVVDNGHLFNVANPLVIWLSAPYPGLIADRVSLAFTHLQVLNGSWVAVAPQTYIGSVIATGLNAGTNTATILFDKSSFISKNDEYAPVVGNSLSILTFNYTNYVNSMYATNGTGTFQYTNYSPIGSLLQLITDGLTNYYILSFTNPLDSDSGAYYLETYGAGFSASSGVFSIAAPPVITVLPQNTAATNGGSATFNVTASGSLPLTYQWVQVGAGSLTDGVTAWGSMISGSLTTSLTISGVTNNDLGNYQVIITNIYGTVTSSVANLAMATPPQITTPPSSVGPLSSGDTAKFSVIASGSPTLNYQWQRNGTNLHDGVTLWNSTISGALTANLNISNVSTNDRGYYQVIINNNYGSATNNPPGAQMTVQ